MSQTEEALQNISLYDNDENISGSDIDPDSLPMPDENNTKNISVNNEKLIGSLEEVKEEEEEIDPLNEELDEMDENSGFIDTVKWVGYKLFDIADFLGEVFAEFFGMTQSRYQNVIDAYHRQKRWEEEDRKKEQLAKEQYLKQMMDEYDRENDININNNNNQNEILEDEELGNINSEGNINQNITQI